MKIKSIILVFLLVTAFVQPLDLAAQSGRSSETQYLDTENKVDPAWKDFVDGTLKGNNNKQSNGGNRQQMPTQHKSNKPITKTFLGCTFGVTTMEEAIRLFSNKNYKGEVGERDILLYGVKFADNEFPVTQFTFNNDIFCIVNFVSIYDNQKQALSRRSSLKKQLSKKYNLVEDVIGKYKCYYAGDNNRVVELIVQEVDEKKSETGKIYYVYLQYVDIKQTNAANDEL